MTRVQSDLRLGAPVLVTARDSRLRLGVNYSLFLSTSSRIRIGLDHIYVGKALLLDQSHALYVFLYLLLL
jgi:hypothetical protein